MAYQNGPKIITDGLVMYLDAGNPKSYPGSGTLWTDLTRNGNNGTLTNGPTFNSENGGGIVFDGSNDYVLTNYSANPSEITFELVVKPLNISTGTEKSFLGKFDGSQYFSIGLQSADSSIYRVGNGGGTIDSNFIPANTSSFYSITVTNTSGARLIYVNGDLKNGSAATATPSNVAGALYIGSVGGAFWYAAFALYSLKVYNRILSASEILQNYNATKGRFKL
jgi:hypothetical protein